MTYRALIALSCLVAGAGFGQTRLTWRADLQTNVRVRTPTALDLATTVAGDLELAPRLSAVLAAPGWSIGLGYFPSFRFREPWLSPRFDYSQRASADLEWRPVAGWRFLGTGSLSQGLLDLSTIQRTQGTAITLDPVRLVGQVRELSGDATVGFEHDLTRSAQWVFQLGYTWGGGSDADSRRFLPIQLSPRALSRVVWTATPTDFFLVQAQLRYSIFTTLAQVLSGELDVGWRTLLGPRTTFEAGLGLATAVGNRAPFDELVNQPPGGPMVTLGPAAVLPNAAVMPAGRLSLSHRLEWRTASVDLNLSGNLAPFVDRFLALVYERADGQGSVTVTLQRDFSTYARAGATQAFGTGSGNLATTYLEAGAGYEGARWWRVDLSARHATLFLGPALDGSPQAPQVQWLVGLGFTLRSEGAW
ncbi:MAG: hypothetical protein K1X89_05785 [Myxococcaceae bacterium]|nr:hypothetical protein [Myxococcaceae bacterium]